MWKYLLTVPLRSSNPCLFRSTPFLFTEVSPFNLGEYSHFRQLIFSKLKNIRMCQIWKKYPFTTPLRPSNPSLFRSTPFLFIDVSPFNLEEYLLLSNIIWKKYPFTTPLRSSNPFLFRSTPFLFSEVSPFNLWKYSHFRKLIFSKIKNIRRCLIWREKNTRSQLLWDHPTLSYSDLPPSCSSKSPLLTWENIRRCLLNLKTNLFTTLVRTFNPFWFTQISPFNLQQHCQYLSQYFLQSRAFKGSK